MADYPMLGLGVLGKLKVHLVLALVQFGYAGFQLLTKVAFQQGLNKSTYPIYRNLIGFSLLFPLAAHFERKERPKLTCSLFIHFLLLGLAAVVFGQALYVYGLDYTSPTFASALQNSIPAITFILAAITGVEDVNLYQIAGQAKLLGAISAGLGATLMTAYKGPLIIKNALQTDITETESTNTPAAALSISYWHLGSICLVVSCISWASCFVLQAKLLRKYPARISTVCFTNLFGAIELSLFTAVSKPTISIWKINRGLPLISVLYAGLVTSGLVFAAQVWCMQQAGPVIVSAYQPLQTVIVGFISLFFLGESLYLGSIIGAVLIVGGLYLVSWGQEKQQQHVSRPNRQEPSHDDGQIEEGLTHPLLKHEDVTKA